MSLTFPLIDQALALIDPTHDQRSTITFLADCVAHHLTQHFTSGQDALKKGSALRLRQATDLQCPVVSESALTKGIPSWRA
jgi:hypothetical protein